MTSRERGRGHGRTATGDAGTRSGWSRCASSQAASAVYCESATSSSVGIATMRPSRTARACESSGWEVRASFAPGPGADQHDVGVGDEGALRSGRGDAHDAQLAAHVDGPRRLDEGADRRVGARGHARRPVEDARPRRAREPSAELGERGVERERPAACAAASSPTARPRSRIAPRIPASEPRPRMRWTRRPERSSELQEVGVGVLGDHHEVGAQRHELLQVRLQEAVDRRGPRGRRRSRSPARRPSASPTPGDPAAGSRTSTSSAERLMEATRCGAAARRTGWAITHVRNSATAPSHGGDARPLTTTASASAMVRRIRRTPSRLPRRGGGRRRRSRRAPRLPPPGTRTGRRNAGPSQAKVWNSPFSPQGSTPAGSSSSSARSKARPAKVGGSTRGSTQVSTAFWPESIISSASVPGGATPQREERPQTRRRHAVLAVAPHVLQEEVAEGHAADAPGAGGRRAPAPIAASYASFGQGEGMLTVEQRQADGLGLVSQQAQPHGVHRDPVGRLVDGGEQADHLHVPPRAGRGGQTRCPCRCSRRGGPAPARSRPRAASRVAAAGRPARRGRGRGSRAPPGTRASSRFSATTNASTGPAMRTRSRASRRV